MNNSPQLVDKAAVFITEVSVIKKSALHTEFKTLFVKGVVVAFKTRCIIKSS